MSIKELRAILEKENVWKYDYSLSDNEPPMCEVTSCLRKKSDRYEHYVSERNAKRDVKIFKSEDEACRSLLAEMSYDYPTLKQYIAAN